MHKFLVMITSGTIPKDIKHDGTLVAPNLDYVSLKKRKLINIKGELTEQVVTLTKTDGPIEHGVIWMVASTEDALATLESYGVYPFDSLSAAKLFAKRLGLTGYTVFPV